MRVNGCTAIAKRKQCWERVGRFDPWDSEESLPDVNVKDKILMNDVSPPYSF